MLPLPPLSALRAFEAASRHMSFRRAAAELGVTPGAISHQIRMLEGFLGVALFVRLNRALRLTDAGRDLAGPVQASFAGLVGAVARIRDEGARTVTVSVGPSIAAKWLAPRLHRFAARHPEIDVRVLATTDLSDLSRDGVDVAIRHSRGSFSGLHGEHLMASHAFPVCSPEIAATLREPADLARCTLLHDENPRRFSSWADWPDWLAAAGVPWIDHRRGPVFGSTHLALDAAIASRGVAIGIDLLVAEDIAAGRLVRPFVQRLPSPLAHWVLCLPERADLPKLAALRAWLQEEAVRCLTP